MHQTLYLSLLLFLLDKFAVCQDESRCETVDNYDYDEPFGYRCDTGECISMQYMFQYVPGQTLFNVCEDNNWSGNKQRALDFILKNCHDTNPDCVKGCDHGGQWRWNECCRTCKLEGCKEMPANNCNGVFDCNELVTEDSTQCAFCKYLIAEEVAKMPTPQSRQASSNKTETRHLIKTSDHTPPIPMTEAQMKILRKKDIKYIVVPKSEALRPSSHWRSYIPDVPLGPKEQLLPKRLRFGKTVMRVFQLLQENRIEDFVTRFSSYPTRHYLSPTGINASIWLHAYIQDIIVTNGYSDKATVTLVPCNLTVEELQLPVKQNNVIVRLQGSHPEKGGEMVILGAHLDSITRSKEVDDAAPGADDNASGCAAIIEAFRAILESGYLPQRTLEFHFYAAEEANVIGSREIADNYITKKEFEVMSYFNLDVVGYMTKHPVIGLIWDYTSKVLNEFMKLLIENYISEIPWKIRCCGYGCTDNYFWHTHGVPSVTPMEIQWTPTLHSSGDEINTVNFYQVLQFTKLAVAYAVELSEPARV